MKTSIIVCVTILLIVAAICSAVVGVSFANRDRPHVDSSEEVYEKECAKRGGDLVIKNGRQNGIYIDEKSCEVQK